MAVTLLAAALYLASNCPSLTTLCDASTPLAGFLGSLLLGCVCELEYGHSRLNMLVFGFAAGSARDADLLNACAWESPGLNRRGGGG